MVPSGTHIPLVLHNAISTRSARPGDPVYFETLYPVMIDGKVVIPAGSYVSGEVTESKRPGRVKGRGELAIKMTNLILPNAYQVNMNATPTGAGTGGGETTNSEGVIVGETRKAVELPRLRFSVRDAQGAEIYAWNAVLEQPVLKPGEKAWFKSRLASPPPEGRNIDVRFFSKRDIAGGSA